MPSINPGLQFLCSNFRRGTVDRIKWLFSTCYIGPNEQIVAWLLGCLLLKKRGGGGWGRCLGKNVIITKRYGKNKDVFVKLRITNEAKSSISWKKSADFNGYSYQWLCNFLDYRRFTPAEWVLVLTSIQRSCVPHRVHEPLPATTPYDFQCFYPPKQVVRSSTLCYYRETVLRHLVISGKLNTKFR